MASYEREQGDEQPFRLPAVDPECETCFSTMVDLTPQVILDGQQAFVPQQFILTGPTNDIDDLLDAAGISLDALAVIAMEGMTGNATIDGDLGGVREVFAVDELPKLEIRLYELPVDQPLAEVFPKLLDALTEIRQAAIDAGVEEHLLPRVLLDLNYVTGFRIDGAPWSVEGVPWSVEGVPWSVEGVAGGGPSATNPEGHPFWTQWAFNTDQGIGQVDKAGSVHTLANYTGAGIRVGLFDSTPFEDEGCYDFTTWLQYPPAGDAAGWPYSLYNWRPVTLPETNPIVNVGEVDVDISDHGFFAAGLTYGVAPKADLHLVRVLNDRGQGDLHALLRALAWFTDQVLGCNDGTLHAPGEEGPVSGTVYNLSLVARPDNEGSDLPLELVEVICEIAKMLNYPRKPFPVMSLELAMQMITAQGGVIVAAAGNDSAGQDPALTAGLPAAYANVVGVGASNAGRQKSCYSNTGDLYAPGGDGAPDDQGNPCMPATDQCPNRSDPAGCELAVISVTARVPQPGFGFWVGTSFATPLVSGLAAQRLEASVDPSAVEGSLTPQGSDLVQVTI